MKHMLAVLAALAWSIQASSALAAETWRLVGRLGGGALHLEMSNFTRLIPGEEYFEVATQTVFDRPDAAGATRSLTRSVVHCERLTERALSTESFDAAGRSLGRRAGVASHARAIDAMRDERFEFNARVSPVCDAISAWIAREGAVRSAGSTPRTAPLVGGGGVNGIGVFGVGARINGVADEVMVVDSGASVVVIPATLADRLRRTGTLRADDESGTRRFRTADGRTVEAAVVTLRSIEIGGHVVRNVEASVMDGAGASLLGQSYLSRLRHWSLNRNRQSFEFTP